VNAGASEGLTFPAQRVTPVELLSNETNIICNRVVLDTSRRKYIQIKYIKHESLR
jgi:hypothetical protein